VALTLNSRKHRECNSALPDLRVAPTGGRVARPDLGLVPLAEDLVGSTRRSFTITFVGMVPYVKIVELI
jgi:hypothetical protein